MKQINAIIQPQMLNKVERALHTLPHFPGFTLLRVKGHARKLASADTPRSLEWDLDEHDKIMLLVLSTDEMAAQVVDIIRSHAHTGLPGDGLIWISDVDQIVRIRTEESGKDAV